MVTNLLVALCGIGFLITMFFIIRSIIIKLEEVK